MTAQSLYFYDLETWGANPKKDQACQFAGVRTDLELNIISEPLNILCRIHNDQLPSPEAALITGITPQQTLRDGLSEPEFIAKIHAQFMQPGTCVAGYNNIRFDDEVMRFTFYRNFYDAYAREWQNGNSRWDIIDMLRACYALRPEGIVWPDKEDGSPSFKLEALSAANGIEHEDAHDAMSDVYATVAMAKLVKQKQPRLFQYLFDLRNKKQVQAQLDYFNFTPFVHVSSKLPALQGCTSWMVPVAAHPTNKNAVIAVNLADDPTSLLTDSAEQLAQKLYTPTHMLDEGEQRPPIKLIHANKCPVIAPAKTLTEENAERLGIDRQQCLQHLQQIRQHPEIGAKLQQMYELSEPPVSEDADYALYGGGFFSERDKNAMEQVREADANTLSADRVIFEDERLNTLLFRYRARNFPTSLGDDEIQRWQHHRQFRLMDEDSPASIKLSEFMQQLEYLGEAHQNSPDKIAILHALYQYAQNL